MKRFEYVLRRVSLKKRLIVSFLLVSLIPVTVLTVLLCYTAYSYNRDSLERQFSQVLNETELRIGNEAGEISRLVNEFSSNSDVVKNIKKYVDSENQVERNTLVAWLSDRILSQFSRNMQDLSIVLLEEDGNEIAVLNEREYSEADSMVAGKIMQTGNRFTITTEEGENGTVLAIGREIINIFSGYRLGWLIVYLDTDIFSDVLKKVDTDLGLAIYSADGNLIADSRGLSPSYDSLGNTERRLIFTDGKVLMTDRIRDFVFVAFSQENILRSLLSNMFLLYAVIFVLVTALIILVSVAITMTVTEPVRKLESFALSLGHEGDFSLRLDDDGDDELKSLTEKFNSMTENLEEQTNRAKEAEIRALEAQINPHFLYNTLDMINWMAWKSNNNDVCTIVNCLSDFFRLSLNRGKEFYTVADEIHHVRCYTTIEHFKRIDTDFIFDIDDKTLDSECPKLILQPLVENALIHGLEKKKFKGRIIIRSDKKAGCVILSVEDDGVGPGDNFSPGVGLKNINMRVEMMYGSEYGVALRREGGKTIAMITLPYKGMNDD